ncbi:hypothetical protein S40288_11738 [Stachybotrys chartarum IBT 40288]|nr:hypothetical protein S40288_11738 [Stachybotrys chartarum IBT 40288]
MVLTYLVGSMPTVITLLAFASILGLIWCLHVKTFLTRKSLDDDAIKTIQGLTKNHVVAVRFAELFATDGAGSWPPKANHATAWPSALEPYRDIYHELSPLLSQKTSSLDDQVNRARIVDFRRKYEDLLRDKVDLEKVRKLFDAAAKGQWDTFPRDVYNAFYCCIASSRHAYRWSIVPVVKVAQLEKTIPLPNELEMPWLWLQEHFGCSSPSGNITSNLLLNFDLTGRYVYRINTGVSQVVTSAEDAFARIFYQVEMLAVAIYRDMVLAIVAFEQGDKVACASHVSAMADQLRIVLRTYYDNMHDQKIPLSVWMSHIQGFYAWSAGHLDAESNEWVIFDGLSGNQVLLFQVLDAFLGLQPYLPARDRDRNIPARQRVLCKAIERHSFRGRLDTAEFEIAEHFNSIARQLRVGNVLALR